MIDSPWKQAPEGLPNDVKRLFLDRVSAKVIYASALLSRYRHVLRESSFEQRTLRRLLRHVVTDTTAYTELPNGRIHGTFYRFTSRRAFIYSADSYHQVENVLERAYFRNGRLNGLNEIWDAVYDSDYKRYYWQNDRLIPPPDKHH